MLKREVEIRGHKIAVYEPTGDVAAGKWLPSGDQVSRALATLSDEQLRNTKEVYIVPHECTSKSASVADYGSMPQTLRYFPRNEPHPQSDIDWAFQHESGHAYSLNEVWKNDPSAREAWKQAISSDRRGVTDYGNTNEVEDFAESVLLYADVLGTPCEASARALFTSRFRELDRLFPHGFPARTPRSTDGAY